MTVIYLTLAFSALTALISALDGITSAYFRRQMSARMDRLEREHAARCKEESL